MSETTTSNSIGPFHSPEARRRAMRTRNGMSLEQKQAIAREAAGKNGKEMLVLAKKHGVSRSSLEIWRKTWGGPAKAPEGVQHGRHTDSSTKREVLARWRASGQSPHAWGKANGYSASTLYGWLGRKGAASRKNAVSLRPQGRRRVANGEASALNPDDQALLAGHDQQKTRDRNLLERVRRLEKENLVLKANLAYAIEAGYMDLFNMDRMFTGKKG